MSTAQIVQIATAVLATLDANAEALSLPYEAERVYDTEKSVDELEALGKTLVSALTAMEEDEHIARRRLAGDFTIYLAVRRRLASRLPAAVDPQIYLMEEIRDLFLAHRLDSLPAAACTEAKIKVVFSAEDLRAHAVHFGLVTLVFHAESSIS
jgi:hypothetical protein